MRYVLPLVLVFISAVFAGAQNTSVSNLRCEMLDSPLGVETSSPALSWVINSTSRGEIQTAYQILVASDPARLNESDADLWNSGKTKSSRSVHVQYAGSPLNSGQRCYWTVRIWDRAGNPTVFSEPSAWEMGLLDAKDWRAKWISAVPPSDTTAPVLPAPFFRKEFAVGQELVRARLYISGLGYSEVYINGSKVGDHALDPAVTRYDKRMKYVVYDVSSQIRGGSNVLGIILGNGWYNQHSRTAWDFDQAPWRDSPAVMAQLELTWSDGTTEVIGTDRSWKFARGPIVFNDVHNGEHYDARKELDGWQRPGYAARGWREAFEVGPFDGVMSSQLMPPVRVTATLKPVSQLKRDDTVVFDFGQNMSGWVRLKVKGSAGSRVVIRHGERVNSRGTLDIKELSRFIRTGEVQTDRYTLKGGSTETWSPRFTYHGFQYAEIILTPGVELVDVAAEVVHTDFNTAGTFICSDTLINRIHQNFKWSYLTNYHSYPTDCPHREKMGWTGDAHLVAQAGIFNFDAYFAYRKWLDDFADEQRKSGDLPGIIPTSGWGYTYGQGPDSVLGYGPQWEGAYLMIAWDLYRFTGDSALVRRHYVGFKRYVDFLGSKAKNNLIAFGIDDHKQLRPITDGDILSAGLYFHLAELLSKMADVINRPRDQETYLELSGKIKTAFNKKYFDSKKGIYGAGGQTQLSEALALELVNESERKRVAENLLRAISENNTRVETGVVGTKWLIHALMNEGSDDVLYRMISHTEFPGWGYWIKLGATTLFQNWDGSQSRNHVMFGSVCDYFYQGLAGIRPRAEDPGFKSFSVMPLLNNDVTFVKATHQSPYGLITVDWEKKDQFVNLKTRVPSNTTAFIHFPVSDPLLISEGGQPLQRVEGVAGITVLATEVIVEVGSGIYEFKIDKTFTK